MFAAFNGDGSVVFVSFVCAWYEDGVTAEKVRDQISKSDLSNQFRSARGNGVLRQRKDELSSLCKQDKVHNLRVSVELPHRKGNAQCEEEGVFVIEQKNVKNVLGFGLATTANKGNSKNPAKKAKTNK